MSDRSTTVVPTGHRGASFLPLRLQSTGRQTAFTNHSNNFYDYERNLSHRPCTTLFPTFYTKKRRDATSTMGQTQPRAAKTARGTALSERPAGADSPPASGHHGLSWRTLKDGIITHKKRRLTVSCLFLYCYNLCSVKRYCLIRLSSQSACSIVFTSTSTAEKPLP